MLGSSEGRNPNWLANLVELTRCSRRNGKPNSSRQNSNDNAKCQVVTKEALEYLDDSDVACKSTDASEEMSFSDVSNDSHQYAGNSDEETDDGLTPLPPRSPMVKLDQGGSYGCQEEITLGLKQQLDKLSPQSAAAVGAYLVSKVSETPAPFQAPPGLDCPHDNREGSLAENLRELALVDASRILMLRKVKSITDSPHQALEDYFSKFGTVERVLFSCHKKAGGRCNTAHMVMGDAKAARAVLARGEEHIVQGVKISVLPFKNIAEPEESVGHGSNQERPEKMSPTSACLSGKPVDNVRGRTPALTRKENRRPFTPFQGFSTQEKQKKARVDYTLEDSLATNLRELATMDATHVLMLRKIKGLQGNPVPALEAYFSQFGTVKRILLSLACAGSGRICQSNVAFLVMDSATEVQSALALGKEQVVQDATICVLPFKNQADM